ncbi:hypothetical protein PybrP1_005457 [[Pythium] brassicae (nom. inval.)]|nr:hypothetical protein PybrP1_005457 [[Pythium] brassicae (nom. inval.)]
MRACVCVRACRASRPAAASGRERKRRTCLLRHELEALLGGREQQLRVRGLLVQPVLLVLHVLAHAADAAGVVRHLPRRRQEGAVVAPQREPGLEHRVLGVDVVAVREEEQHDRREQRRLHVR